MGHRDAPGVVWEHVSEELSDRGLAGSIEGSLIYMPAIGSRPSKSEGWARLAPIARSKPCRTCLDPTHPWLLKGHCLAIRLSGMFMNVSRLPEARNMAAWLLSFMGS